MQVLTEPKNALGKQYKKLFQMNGVSFLMVDRKSYTFWLLNVSYISLFLFFKVKLHYTEGALKLIAKKAITKNTGARGLRSLLENILMDAMYEVCKP